MKISQVPISTLQSDKDNARLHSERNLDVIAKSLSMFGQRKPIVVHNGTVIAGNGTLEAAKALGWEEITITEVPENWDLETAKAYAIADNRTAELAEWNEETLIKQLLELENDGWEIKDFGFDDLKIQDTETISDNLSNYTKKINVPEYEIVGDKPELTELFNRDKHDNLVKEIKKANLPKEVEEFLTFAATRHIVFNYTKIAEYYPHVSPEVQELMETSALVLIDFDDAIKNGYANFMLEIDNLEAEDADYE